MKASLKNHERILVGGLVLSVTAGAGAALLRYTRNEIKRRGYPTWEECQCDFKLQDTIFQVWHSKNEQRGETIVSQEWGLYLVKLPSWLRQLLHHSTQVLATLNPRKHYMEHVALSPQESYQLASILRAASTNEDLPEPTPDERSYVAWRREVLHFPSYLFDANLSRLYPAHIAPEKVEHVDPLPALWDHQSNLPLPTEGTLLHTPLGTRIDCIGWAPAQISYCTARVHTQK